MNREHWPEVKSILEQALEMPAAEREAFVSGACRGDATLLREVDQYLACATAADMLLPDRGPAELAGAATEALPQRIGPYRVVREIGRGGMGVVYLAERDDGEYKRAVAIKLVQNGAGDAQFTKLFWRERQILAQLDHPNIARLLDGGTTDAGQPYYAMEFVEGVSLQEFCARQDFTLRQKLELFLGICSAVSYAHRNLVIHRDLKPQNILITADGTPKLLDFGLAKLLEEGSHSTEKTTQVMLLTPSYASPEQIKGEPLTVATDIYSLGVLLYELLSGEHPYGVPAGPIAAVCAVLEEPPRPLRRSGIDVPADLEKIIQVALRKEPQRRYASVDAFSEDVRRYLGGYPVHAAGDSLRYRAGKFIKRRRWALAVGLAAAVALTISGVMTWRAKQNAELRFQQVRGLAHSVVFELHDAIADLPGSTGARRLLVARALEYLNALTKDRGNDPELMFELAQAYKKIGDAQGYHAVANLGDPAGALESYTKARELLLELRRRAPSDANVERSLAFVDEEIANVLPQQESALILERQNEAVSLFKDVSQKNSGLQSLRDLGQADFDLGEIKALPQGDFQGAIETWRTALNYYLEIERAAPESDRNRRSVAMIEERIAGAYYALGDCTNSIVYDRKAAAIDEARVAGDPDNETAQSDLSSDLVEIGWCLNKLGDRKGAIDTLERTISLRRAVVAKDPQNARAQSTLETALRIAGDVMLEAGDMPQALNLEHEAAAIGLRLSRKHPNDTDRRANLALDRRSLGLVYQREAKWGRALEEFETASNLANGIRFEDPHEQQAITGLPDLIAQCREKTKP